MISQHRNALTLEITAHALIIIGASLVLVVTPLSGWNLLFTVLGACFIFFGSSFNSKVERLKPTATSAMAILLIKKVNTTAKQRERINEWINRDFDANQLIGTWEIEDDVEHSLQLTFDGKIFSMSFKNTRGEERVSTQNRYIVEGQTVSFSSDLVKTGFMQTPMPVEVSRDTLLFKTKERDVSFKKVEQC